MARPAYRFRHLLATITLVAIVSGCATTPDDDTAARDRAALLQFAEQAERDGNHEAASNAYKQLALVAPAAKHADFQIRAITQLLAGNYISQAKRTLQVTSSRDASATQRLELRLLSARIALAEGAPALALELLRSLPAPTTTREQHARYHQLRAQAYRRAGNLLEATREYILREPFLATPLGTPPLVPNAAEENQLQIWQSLMMLSDEMLLQLRIEPPPDPLSGWLELAYLTKQAQHPDASSDLAQSLTAWHERYPNLQVSEKILAAIGALQTDGIFYPRQVALLLPLSGNFAQAAAVIRDGFLAAHFDNTTRSDEVPPPLIHIYNTATQGRTTNEIYQQAIEDGAEFIVGPLKKQSVNSLLQTDNSTVPTLTLNYGSEPALAKVAALITDKLFQFGLSPEDEARQVAERAWLDGYNQALTIVPEGAWGARILNAFNESWEALNGTIVEQQRYASSKNDFSGPLRNLLNIDESRKRKNQLQQLLGTPLKFEPRRRQDADFVFMVAFPRQARLIKPQLKFHYAGDLPVYATSHVYSGTPNREANRDIDGVFFCDIPWVLNGAQGTGNLDTRIQRLWPEESAQYSRFYALGIDAYNLIPHIKRMATFRYERHQGETGSLSLDDSNRIFRQLTWARFKSGIARPL